MSALCTGVDEAGRGPVIGPMVVCAVCIPEGDRGVLENIGARDSKDLSSQRREDVAKRIRAEAETRGWGIGLVVCEARRIDSNSISSDLNSLEIELFGEAIEAASPREGEGRIMADACDVDEERFARRLACRLGDGWSSWQMVARHGMDADDRVAGAASILAKIERDAEVARLESELGIRLGSGYPSDRITRQAVRELVSGGLPHDCLRWSWSTVSDAWEEVHGGPVPMRSADGAATVQSSLDEWSAREA